MAFSVRSITTQHGRGTSFDVTPPGGTDAYDDLFLLLLQEPAIQVENPREWALKRSHLGSTTLRLYRLESVADSGPWTFEFVDGLGGPAKSSRYAISLLVIERSSNTAVCTLDGIEFAGGAASNTVAECPAVAPTGSPSILVNAVGWGRATSFSTAGEGDLAEVRSGDTDQDVSLGVAVEVRAVHGDTGPRTIAIDNPFGYSARAPSVASFAIGSHEPAGQWAGDFESGNLGKWSTVHRAAEDRIEVRTDTPPDGLSAYARFTADDDDVYPFTVTANPRAQLDGPYLMYEGFTRFLSFSFRIPPGFPKPDARFVDGQQEWLLLMQVHGPTFAGPPSISVFIHGDHVVFENSAGNQQIHRVPIVHGEWMRFTARVHFAKGSKGWADLWYQGRRQRLLNGKLRYHGPTMWDYQNFGLFLIATLYRRKGIWPGSLSVDQAGYRVDTTAPSGLDLAAPRTQRVPSSSLARVCRASP